MINYAGTHMPPLFIWHNRDDQYVSAANPLMIATRMTELGLPFELHLSTVAGTACQSPTT